MHDLSPCVTFSPTENSYICKYLASEDIVDSNMTAESQIKLWGNGIFHSGRLVSLCYWAQQSKAPERVLDTQFQPFQTMHVYYFLVMVYSFPGRGLLNDCFMVMKSIICVHIIICRHRSRINCSQLGVNIEVTDWAVISWRVIAMFLFWHTRLQSLCWLWCCKSHQ